MLFLDKKKIEYFAKARYDMVFGALYQHTRTFSFPFQFEIIPVLDLSLTKDSVTAKTNVPDNPQIFTFFITCHQFWLHPEKALPHP